MKTSVLYKFLINEINSNDFVKSIDDEIKKYQYELTKKGATAHLYIEDDLHFIFSKKHILSLCDHFINGEINQFQLEYIVDSILLDEFVSYEEPDLIDFLEEMTDLKINGAISKSEILNIKNVLLS